MSAEDKRIGANIARIRSEKSQAEVANAMRSCGWKWAQNTVSAVESGERPLRLAEAVDLARVLGARSADEFAREDEFVTFVLWARRIFESYERLKAAVAEFEHAQVSLALTGDMALDAGVPPTNEIIAPLDSWVTKSVVEVVEDIFLGAEPLSAEEVAAYLEGRSERGANGAWMNRLFDAVMRARVIDGRLASGQHPEAP